MPFAHLTRVKHKKGQTFENQYILAAENEKKLQVYQTNLDTNK